MENTGDIGTRDHVEQTFPCGCKIRHYTNLYCLDESYGITYCPLHKAAPKLLLALKEITELAPRDKLKLPYAIQVVEIADRAIAKVEGK